MRRLHHWTQLARLAWELLGPWQAEAVTRPMTAPLRTRNEIESDLRFAKAMLDHERSRQNSRHPINNPLDDRHPDVAHVNALLEEWVDASLACL